MTYKYIHLWWNKLQICGYDVFDLSNKEKFIQILDINDEYEIQIRCNPGFEYQEDVLLALCRLNNIKRITICLLEDVNYYLLLSPLMNKTCNIQIYNCRIDDTFTNWFANARCIRSLFVQSSEFINNSLNTILEIIKNTTTLKDLHLRRMGDIYDSYDVLCDAINNNQSLKLIDLSENGLTTSHITDTRLIDAINHHPTLNTVQLEYNEFRIEIIEYLSTMIKGNRKIKKFSMRECTPFHCAINDIYEAIMINTRIVSCRRTLYVNVPFDISGTNRYNIKKVMSLVSDLHQDHKDLLDTTGSFINYNVIDRTLYALKRMQIRSIITNH